MPNLLNTTIYHYIIVGAGSAGCVLANRLSADPHINVLLLEAGKPDRKPEIQVPAAFSKLLQTECDWGYYTELQSQLDCRQLYWPRGKVLGGSSSINAMIYVRGHPCDYDQWAKLGNPGWSFSDLLPYFKKGENYEAGASEYHGTGGLLNVASLRYRNPLSRAFVEAGVEIGLLRTDDFNGSDPQGVGFYHVTQKNGQRHSAATAYLEPCRHRKNLSVSTGAQVTRVLFEGTRVVGVEYVSDDGKIARVKTAREVILCGGAVNSPQLLMLSGIGPAEHLRSLGIRVVVDLSGVGQNLQDHLIAGVVYRCTQPVSLDGANTWSNRLKYLLFRKGPLSSNVGEAGGFVKTQPDLMRPDLQFLFAPVYFVDHGFVRLPGYGFTLGATLLHPESVGSIRLRSPDPLDAPIIQPNYLDREIDLQVLISGIKLSRQILEASAFDRFRDREVLPGSVVQQDEQIAAYIRQSAQTLYHPVGTCKMGNDSMAVVNSKLQVYGVERLRVVDASIAPTIMGGNTNAPTMAIAEKAADLIISEG